jgi:large subunit ribosomal protein L3
MGGIIGRKVGMTRVFDDTGNQVPVTVVEAGPCPVTQVKTTETDGYAAIQLGFGSRKAKHAAKAQVGHAEKAGLEAAPRILREVPSSDDAELSVGEVLTVEQFEPGDRVKVTGASKGRGFQGVVRRHGFAGRPGGHGHPLSRTPGSVGPGTDPSRVIKGKKLPGRMGGGRVTIRNLQVVKVDGDRNLLFLKGGVPGARDSYVLITKSK